MVLPKFLQNVQLIAKTFRPSQIQIRCFCSQLSNPNLTFPRHGREESDEEFDERYFRYFSRPEIDGWEIRKGINDLQGHDLIPEPKIIEALLRACRRVNDHSLCVRYLEACKWKADNCNKEIWPWLMQELEPVLKELGISTPDQLGYSKPELSMPDPFSV